ncbi:MAG: peptidase S11 [Burkholderiales bacterium RIFCSPLOWO2_02_FULL_57_36]|nr:MAG: peptidase S11 [Burkholderiales bacterium RIFCSPLOWO2_02_FULL_57_36]
MFKKSLLAIVLAYASAASALPFSSQHAIVFEEASGKILLQKNANAIVPIASLTKLMTAMVVLDARQDMDEMISIEETDVDTIKHSSSRVPVGSVLSRKTILQLALMSSDNRAAAALGRTYPGGIEAFDAAVKQKLEILDMHDTVIAEPTGLSARNRSTAVDLVKMVTAASYYPEIAQMSTEAGDLIDMNGEVISYRNTNRLVGQKDWDISVSKTGFTREAGRCLIMRMQLAGRHVIVVLLNAKASTSRMLDAKNIQHYLSGRLSSIVTKTRSTVRATAARVTKKKKSTIHVVASKNRTRLQ